MKKITLISLLALSVPNLVAQDAVAAENTQSTKKEISASFQKSIDAFNNLPEEKRKTFMKRRSEAGVLFKNKRVFEALEALRENDDIFNADPQSINLRGACFVEIRDFAKASEQFKQSEAITGPNLNVSFNLGESDFVAQNWKSSIGYFEKALTFVPEKSASMKYLIEFKIFLGHLALSKDESLSEGDRKTHSEKATQMADLYDFLVNSPYYYYAQASIAFSKGDKEEGQKILAQARRVYSGNPAAISSWEDTLTEYGYIVNFYGQDADNAVTPK